MQNILVVDDDQFVRATLKNMLEFMGYKVVLANDGIEGLEVFLKKHIDLVLTDLEMPLMDGGSLAHMIKHNSPETPVVLVTDSETEEVKVRLRNGSVDSVLAKPCRLEGILKCLKDCLPALN